MSIWSRVKRTTRFTWPLFDRIHYAMARFVDERSLKDDEPYRFRFDTQTRTYEIADPTTEDEADANYTAGEFNAVIGLVPPMYIMAAAVTVAIWEPGLPWAIAQLAVTLVLGATAFGGLGYAFDELDTEYFDTEQKWLRGGIADA